MTMTVRARSRKALLTAYEKQQVEQIAAWKSRPPDPFTELWSALTLPVTRILARVVPRRLVETMVEKADDVAALLAGQEDIKRQAGVQEISKLLDRPLQDCDRLARQTGFAAQALATIEGAATGAGGVWTTVLDIPLLMVLSLRTIRKIGHCYGYPLNDTQGRMRVLGTLLAGMSGSVKVRYERLQRLRELEDLVVKQTAEDVLTQEALSLLFQLEVFEEVPGIDIVSGAVINLLFMTRVEVTARRVFQERWLRDNGKVQHIEPAEVPAHVLAGGLSGALVRAGYAGCYCLGYGVALPSALLSTVFAPMNNALTRGIRDGAASADQRAEQVVSEMQAQTRPRRRAGRAAPAFSA